MNQLTAIFIDQFALLFLAQFLLTTTLILYIWRAPDEMGLKWTLIATFAGISLYTLATFFQVSAVWDRALKTVPLQTLSQTIITIALINFAYTQPKLHPEIEPPHPKRQKSIAQTITFVIGLVILVIQLYQLNQLQTGSNIDLSPRVVDTALFIGLIWVAQIAYRRLYLSSAYHNPELEWWQHILTPRHPETKSIAHLMTIAPIMLLLGLAMTIAAFELLPKEARNLIPTFGISLMAFITAVLRFTTIEKKTSFVARLIAFSLMTILVIVGTTGFILAANYTTLLEAAQSEDISPQTLQFAPNPSGGYQVNSQSFMMDDDYGEKISGGTSQLPFEFPFYGRRWTTISLDTIGVIRFGDGSPTAYRYNYQPAIANMQYRAEVITDIYWRQTADQLTLTWQTVAPFNHVTQIKLYDDGRFALSYQQINSQQIRRFGTQSGNGGTQFSQLPPTRSYTNQLFLGDGSFTDYAILSQQTLHPFMRPLAYLMISILILVFLGFILLLRVILIRPLNNLISGVHAVEAGNLQTKLPVLYGDEIGTVTEAFNNMVHAVYQADQHLEAQVAQRTHELARSEQRFRGLASAAYETIIIHTNGRITDINQTVTPLLGYSPEELHGRPIISLIADHSHELFTKMQNKGDDPFEVNGITKDGALVPLEIRTSTTLLSSDINTSTAQVLIARDLRERKEIEEQRERLGALEERERIGRELHDDLGQVLGYINVQSEAAQQRLQQHQFAQAGAILQQLSEVSQDTHNNIRQYILGLRQDKEQSFDNFWETLQAYLDRFSTRYNITTTLTIAPELNTSSPMLTAVESQLLRIIQEGLHNIYKHATATQIDLHFTTETETITLSLSDNGRGFDPTAIDLHTDTTHFGLKIMQERAEMVNGRFRIDSTPDQGTTITVHMPRHITEIIDETNETATDQPNYPWKVLLVDDHPLFLEGLGNMLNTFGINVIGSARNGREAEALIRKRQPDLVLMDIHMPQQDGIETTKRVKEIYPDLKIVMLTMAADEELLFSALKHGASGYLLKSLPAPQFVTMLADVMAGQTVLSPNLASQVLTTLARGDVSFVPPGTDSAEPKAEQIKLTDRQQEVLKCLATGMNNKEIAQALFISQSTVKYHIGQIMERLHLHTRHQLIRYQIDQEHKS